MSDNIFIIAHKFGSIASLNALGFLLTWKGKVILFRTATKMQNLNCAGTHQP